MGNSPFEYLGEDIMGEKVAITTTNGTRAIEAAREADQIVIGSFLNLSSTASFIKSAGSDLLILCAGWKGAVNIEDTLYSGALIHQLKENYSYDDDASTLALDLFVCHQDNLVEIIGDSSHARRLNNLDVIKDIEFCSKVDAYDVVAIIDDGRIVKANHQ